MTYATLSPSIIAELQWVFHPAHLGYTITSHRIGCWMDLRQVEETQHLMLPPKTPGLWSGHGHCSGAAVLSWKGYHSCIAY